MKKYLNEAIIGNKEIKVGLTEKGEIIRINHSNMDFRGLIEFLHMGIKVNDSNIIYLHDDSNNLYRQDYLEDTNILKTEIKNTYFNLLIEQTDFVCLNTNAIIRKYVFINEHEIPLDIKFLVHSKMKTDDNNYVSGKKLENGLLQYAHDYDMAIIANELKCIGHKIHGADEAINSGILEDKDYIGMTNNSAVSFEVGLLNPGEKKEFNIIIFANENNDKNKLEDIEEKISKLGKLDVKKELQTAKTYWRKYVKSHMAINFDVQNVYMAKIQQIYIRTILLFPLLTNQTTGRNFSCNGSR